MRAKEDKLAQALLHLQQSRDPGQPGPVAGGRLRGREAKGDGQIWGHGGWMALCGGLGVRKSLCHQANGDRAVPGAEWHVEAGRGSS